MIRPDRVEAANMPTTIGMVIRPLCVGVLPRDSCMYWLRNTCDPNSPMPIETLAEVQEQVYKVHASPALLDYLQDLLEASRRRHRAGLSPRAGLALLHAAQAWALMQGREIVLPEDIQAVGIAVMAHRLGHDMEATETSGRTLAQNLLREVPVP